MAEVKHACNLQLVRCVQALREKWLPRATAQDHVVRADLSKLLKEGWQDGRGRRGKPGKGAPG